MRMISAQIPKVPEWTSVREFAEQENVSIGVARRWLESHAMYGIGDRAKLERRRREGTSGYEYRRRAQ